MTSLAEQAVEPDPVTVALIDLGVTAVAAEETQRALRVSVKRARDAGATWERVAQVLGVKKQTAWERFWRVCQ